VKGRGRYELPGSIISVGAGIDLLMSKSAAISIGGVTPLGAFCSVSVDFDQPLVADAEVVCDFVEDDVAYLGSEAFRIVGCEALDRSPEDGDLVGEHRRIRRRSPRQGDPPVEAEQPLPRRRFVLDDDFDVRERVAKIGR